ncbi:hypothetical protein U9M48_000916 [Paspalum notatum var. saurae]|uniref:AAA+ ATPase domain-containing protein n=1 Tax=Paspalum notatum var. saurae TaxID=547442 RepID=A0AAQ3PFB7_PASNO
MGSPPTPAPALPNPWIFPSLGLAVTFLGWWIQPSITFHLNKLFSNQFDPSRKLQFLESNIIPDLKQTLRHAEGKRMMGEYEDDKMPKSDLVVVHDNIMKVLKSALYEAEDIIDLVDYHLIEKRVIGDKPAGACFSRIKSHTVSWAKHIISDAFKSCVKSLFRPSIADSATLEGSSSVQEVTVTIDAESASVPGAVPATESASSADAVSSSEGPEPIFNAEGVSNAESISRVQKLFDWLSGIINCCQSMLLSCLSNAFSFVLYLRDFSNELCGVRNNQEDGLALHSFPHAVSKTWFRERIQKIEDILSDSRKSPLLNQQSNSSEKSMWNEIRQKDRNIRPEVVFGRDKERKNICRMLRDGPSSSSISKGYSVICIHGIAGSGKSTLAQYVCDYESKLQGNEKYFDPVMFVDVYRSFSILGDMLKLIKGKKEEQPSDDRGRPGLQEEPKEKLMGRLKGRRFLLVLDDVRDNNMKHEDLRDLQDVLNCGKSGSAVLVTAQNAVEVRTLDVERHIAISNLEEEQCILLFRYHALQGTDSFDDQRRIHIGKEIAKKLCMSPMAVVAVANGLRHKDITKWKRTAGNLDALKGTREALWWSYQQLDADIRRCFAYLSTFPRGYKLERVEVVRMWVAQGFIKTNIKEMQVEDLGEEYFDQLVAFSFLQPQRTTYSGAPEYFIIHDLVHLLVEEVAGSDFFRIVSDGAPKYIPSGVHHIFIETNNVAEIAEKSQCLGNLRTLIIEEHYTIRGHSTDMDIMQVTGRNYELENVIERLFKKLTKLRVVIIKLNHKTRVLSVPASVGGMKHLRYLCFCYQPVGSSRLVLPSTFSKLYHLETIHFPSHCIVSYPEDTANNLIYLRHICAPLSFPNISRLTSLQTVTGRFYVKSEPGYELKQLKDLNKLRGTLWISGLENVGSNEEALEAHLASKERVEKLVLSFSRSPRQTMDPDVQAKVFEGLFPPKDLEELSIFNYNGSRYPNWMLSSQSKAQADGPKNLRRLSFHDCSRLASFPEDCILFNCLRVLSIVYCDWESLPENMKHFKLLQSLFIAKCNKIELLPKLPWNLEKIRIYECNVLSKTCREEGHHNWHRIQHIGKTDVPVLAELLR